MDIADVEGGLERARRGELDGVEAHAAACAHIGEDVVNVEDARGRDPGGLDGGPIDLRLGLASSDAAGKNARGEVPQE